jgi:hypothetical protein
MNFMMITKIKTQWTLPISSCWTCLFYGWLAYALFLAHIPVTCEQSIIGKAYHLSSWWMRYSMMKGTLLLSAKYLWTLSFKNSKSISWLLDDVKFHQSHMSISLKTLYICYLFLHWALLNCLWPLWDSLYASMIKNMFTPPKYTKLLH